jgi:hypothetical protein
MAERLKGFRKGRVWFWPLLLVVPTVAYLWMSPRFDDDGFRMSDTGYSLRYYSRAELLRKPIVNMTLPVLGKIEVPKMPPREMFSLEDPAVGGFLVGESPVIRQPKWRIDGKDFRGGFSAYGGTPKIVAFPVPFAKSDDETEATFILGSSEVKVSLPKRRGGYPLRRPPITTTSGAYTIVVTPSDTNSPMAPVPFQLSVEPKDKSFLFAIERYRLQSAPSPTTVARTPLSKNLRFVQGRPEGFWFNRWMGERWEGQIHEVTSEPLSLRITKVRSSAPEIHLSDGRAIFSGAAGPRLEALGFVAVKLDRGFIQTDYGIRSPTTVYLSTKKEGEVIKAYGLRSVHSEPFAFDLPLSWGFEP